MGQLSYRDDLLEVSAVEGEALLRQAFSTLAVLRARILYLPAVPSRKQSYIQQLSHPSTHPSFVPLSSLPTSCFNMANALGRIYGLAIPVAVGFTLAQASMYDVKGGTRAVIFDRLKGVKEDVVNEGTHFLVPWLQKSIIYDVRTKPRNISTTTGSKDLQMVSLTLRVLHRPDVKMLPKIYQVRSPFFLMRLFTPCSIVLASVYKSSGRFYTTLLTVSVVSRVRLRRTCTPIHRK